MKLPQLTLRDLFWILTLAGVLLAWSVDRQQLEARVDESEARATWYRYSAVVAGAKFSDNE